MSTQVMWEGSGWKPISIGDLLEPKKVKREAAAEPAACRARFQGKGRVAQAMGRALRRNEVAVGGRPHPPAPAPAGSHAAVAAVVSPR